MKRWVLPLLVCLAAVCIEKRPVRFFQPVIDLVRDPLLHKNAVADALFRPGLNEAALPALTRQAVDLLSTVNCPTYRLSAAIAENPEWLQRTTEAAYPRMQNPGSPCLLARPDETLPGGCRQTRKEPEVMLVLCP